MEATHKTSLAKGEVGLRDRKPAPTLKEFAERDFLLFARSTFAATLKTLSYYENGIKSLLAFEKLASARLDTITGETIAAFIAHRQDAGLKVSSINRELQALRRMFHLAQEWGAVEKALPAVKMVPGELHRERVLTAAEEDLFFRGAGTGAMEQHADPRLLADVARILLLKHPPSLALRAGVFPIGALSLRILTERLFSRLSRLFHFSQRPA